MYMGGLGLFRLTAKRQRVFGYIDYPMRSAKKEKETKQMRKTVVCIYALIEVRSCSLLMVASRWYSFFLVFFIMPGTECSSVDFRDSEHVDGTRHRREDDEEEEGGRK